MINKALINFNDEKEKFEKEINAETDESKKKIIQNNFKETLKLYLFEANKCLKETFQIAPTPYMQTTGYNGLYQKGAFEIHHKSKNEYYQELDNLIKSNIYLSLDENKKALINNAIYILKLYYEDSLK